MDGDWLYPMLGERLRQARQRRHMTQRQLADRVGLSRASIANIEVGRQKVLLHQVYNIAAALSVDLDALLPEETMATDVERVIADLPDVSRDESEWVKKMIARDGKTR